MNSEGLLVSAAINIGLALLILTVFSILRKQPSNSTIYYPRRLSQHHRLSFDRHLTLRRLLPSVEWIRRAYSVSVEEILDTCGLDVLVLIRLFKFGINFFVVCSLVGLLVLLPVNYKAGGGGTSRLRHSIDYFTISNIMHSNLKKHIEHKPSNKKFKYFGKGWVQYANPVVSHGTIWLPLNLSWLYVLWVHLLCLYFVSCYGSYLLYKEYDDISLKRLQQLRDLRHQPNQFTVLVREIPPCDEHKACGCCVDHFFSKYHPHSYRSYQILYDGKDFKNLLSQARSIMRKIEELKHRSSTKNYNEGSDPSDVLMRDAKLEQFKEKLQEVYHKIQLTQRRMLQQGKELPVAFVTFNTRWGAALAAQSQQHSNPLLWTTEMAPEPRDVLWKNLAIPYRHLPLYKVVVYVAASLLTIFFMIPVTAVQGIAKFELLKKWFPPAMAIQLIPGLRSIVTGYLPSVILNSFVYIVPFAMTEMAKIAGYVSRSRKDMKACNLVFCFLVGNVFFLSLLSGSLLDQIGHSFFHPKDFPSHLATAVSVQADFFMTYILTNGLSGFSLELLQPGLLIWDMMKSHTWDRGKKKMPYLYNLPYYRTIPFVSLCILIGMVYAVVSPLLLPFLVGYFFLGYIVFINQIQDVYITSYETSGQYWPYIHNYIVIAMIITQISMIGLFGLKSKPAASFSTIPLLVFTILFNEYCKIRFLPTFYQCSVKDAMDRDELDKKSGLMEGDLQNAADAYSPPCLLPLNYEEIDSNSILPLVSSI